MIRIISFSNKIKIIFIQFYRLSTYIFNLYRTKSTLKKTEIVSQIIVIKYLTLYFLVLYYYTILNIMFKDDDDGSLHKKPIFFLPSQPLTHNFFKKKNE